MSISTMHGFEVEQRTTRSSVEVRSSGGQQHKIIGGYAIVFGHSSNPLSGGFCEIVEPSFVNKSKADGWPGAVCRFRHRSDMILGAKHSGTLQLAVDSVGLDYTVDLPECRSDVWELVKRGDVRSSSFAFQVTEEDWEQAEGYPVRHPISGKIIDVAPVVLPAYSDSTVSLRRAFAKFFDAPEQDVLEYEQRGELGKFFPHTRSRHPRARRKRMTIEQRQLQIMSWRWETPLTDKQIEDANR